MIWPSLSASVELSSSEQTKDDLSVEDLKKFTDLVAKLSGRPKENGLHVHPLYLDPGNIPMGNGKTDETC